MNTCKTCKFWWQYMRGDGGSCGGLVWIPAEAEGLQAGPLLLHAQLPDGVFMRFRDHIITSSAFGCVHWEAKEPTP